MAGIRVLVDAHGFGLSSLTGRLRAVAAEHEIYVAEISRSWNASLWPFSIPFGLLWLFISLRVRQPEWSYPVGTCLSPYALFYGWNTVLAAMIKKPRLLAWVVGGLWALVIWRLLHSV